MNMTLSGPQVSKAVEFVIDFLEYKPRIVDAVNCKEVTPLELLAGQPTIKHVKVEQQRFFIDLWFDEAFLVTFKLSPRLKSKAFWSYFVEYVKEAV